MLRRARLELVEELLEVGPRVEAELGQVVLELVQQPLRLRQRRGRVGGGRVAEAERVLQLHLLLLEARLHLLPLLQRLHAAGDPRQRRLAQRGPARPRSRLRRCLGPLGVALQRLVQVLLLRQIVPEEVLVKVHWLGVGQPCLLVVIVHGEADVGAWTAPVGGGAAGLPTCGWMRRWASIGADVATVLDCFS